MVTLAGRANYRTVRALEACTGAIQGATGQEAEDAVDTACEALAVLASVCISEYEVGQNYGASRGRGDFRVHRLEPDW